MTVFVILSVYFRPEQCVHRPVGVFYSLCSDSSQCSCGQPMQVCVRVCVCVTYTTCVLTVHIFILPSDLYPPAPVGLDGDGGVRQLVRP